MPCFLILIFPYNGYTPTEKLQYWWAFLASITSKQKFFRYCIMTPPERKRGKSKALLGKANLRGKLDAILEWYELQVTGTIGRSLAKIQWKNIRYYDYDTQWAYYKHNHIYNHKNYDRSFSKDYDNVDNKRLYEYDFILWYNNRHNPLPP